jgi:ferredoxin-NADP reductase
LTQQVAVGDPLEIRGPIGGWFIWRTSQTEPVQLIAGGSGIVPLMAMIRSHEEAKSRVPFRLLYSAREPGAVFYRQELTMLADAKKSVDVRYAFTRVAPKGWPGTPRRIDGALVAEATWPAADMATFYVCGPTSFVESLASYLRINGNSPDRIKTERFGETGSSQ